MCMTTLFGFAQLGHGFEAIDVPKDFGENAFSYFTGAPILIAGDKAASNAMTIGWGAMGNVWSQEPAVTVYVKETRFTHEFMEKSTRFCVMGFDDPKIADYMGSHSGRDGDKAKALGLTIAYTPNGTPYYQEATLVIECETMYGAPFQPSGFRSDAPRRFYQRSPGLHSMYIGRVVGAWRKTLRTVDAATFEAIIEKRSAILLDVRTAQEFDDGHIEGARNLDVSKADFMQQASWLDKGKTILVYCRSGKRSLMAATMLVQAGYHVVNLKGGWLEWSERKK